MSFQLAESPFDLRGAIVLVCFQRPAQLRLTIEYLQRSKGFSEFQTIVIQQYGDAEVTKVIREKLSNVTHITVNHSEDSSIRARINSNIFLGLSKAFSETDCDFAVVLEDDIVVSEDFLWFVRYVVWKKRFDKKFRAVNGFSRMKNAPFRSNNHLGYVRLNFGVGWGWALTRHSFTDLKKIWSGVEDDHWDGLIEDFMRTGYVVNPLNSRIVNVGLDGSGVHSGLNNTLEIEIMDSFENYEFAETFRPFHEKRSSFQWRKDCYNFTINSPFRASAYMYLWISLFRFKCLLTKTANFHNSPPKKILFSFYTRYREFAISVGNHFLSKQ